MQSTPNYYDVLKVARDAPPELIQAAYRTLAMKYHPDRSAAPDAVRMMALINAAYEVLSDPIRRRQHDEWLAGAHKPAAEPATTKTAERTWREPSKSPWPEPSAVDSLSANIERLGISARKHLASWWAIYLVPVPVLVLFGLFYFSGIRTEQEKLAKSEQLKTEEAKKLQERRKFQTESAAMIKILEDELIRKQKTEEEAQRQEREQVVAKPNDALSRVNERIRRETEREAVAENPDGIWTWTVEFNGLESELTLNLKQEGDKLTGALRVAPLRGFPSGVGKSSETPIADGTYKDGQLSFTVTRERNNQKVTVKYMGRVGGNTIKGKSESERDGNKLSRDWEARREGKETRNTVLYEEIKNFVLACNQDNFPIADTWFHEKWDNRTKPFRRETFLTRPERDSLLDLIDEIRRDYADRRERYKSSAGKAGVTVEEYLRQRRLSPILNCTGPEWVRLYENLKSLQF